MKKFSYRPLRGFTLIELIIVLTIMSVISVVFGKFLFHGYQDFLVAKSISNSDWQGFLTLERISNDLHQLRHNSDMTSMQSNQLTFTTLSGESVQYALNNGFFTRNSQLLASNVQNLTFDYYDQNGNVSAVAASVYYIAVSITVAENNIPATFKSVIAIRDSL